MSQNLKPLSETARRLLAAMGESPADHQRAVLAQGNKLLKQEHKSANSTYTLRQANAEAERRLTYSEPSSDIAKRLEEKERLNQIQESVQWIPDAYVLFVRHWRCLSCGGSGSCLEWSGLFLRHRASRSVQAIFAAIKRKDGTESDNRRLYKSIKGFSYGPLPRLEEVVIRTQAACRGCFAESTRGTRGVGEAVRERGGALEWQEGKTASGSSSPASTTPLTIETGVPATFTSEPNISSRLDTLPVVDSLLKDSRDFILHDSKLPAPSTESGSLSSSSKSLTASATELGLSHTDGEREVANG